jgi:two-component system nitrate/nitrite response regulator NarL
VRLSAREREILQLIGQGKSTSEMASLLCVSASTVSTHRTHLLDKLELSSLADLVRFALDHRSFTRQFREFAMVVRHRAAQTGGV